MVPKLSPITDSILKVLSVQAVVVVFGDVTKKPFVATLIISFIWGSTTFHVDDPLFKSNKDRPPVARHSSVHAKIKPPNPNDQFRISIGSVIAPVHAELSRYISA